MNSDTFPAAIAPSSSDVYYKKGYWNDYKLVNDEINRRISGDPAITYLGHFAKAIGNRRFGRALILNCGNGWVEQALYAANLIDSAVGIDISADLLAQARRASTGLPFSYFNLDINSGHLPHAQYDLVVNFAAGHHIASLNRVFQSLNKRLTEDGYFLNYDYIGPHRNQYPYEVWSNVWRVNNGLPINARMLLAYPHLPTMLATDPSEAVHSELFLETFRRYFTVEQYRALGGAIAYPLLTFNTALSQLSELAQNEAIYYVINEDTAYLTEFPSSTFFAYWFGRVKTDVRRDVALLARWQRDEDEREERARANGGIYYPPSLIQALMYSPDGTGAHR